MAAGPDVISFTRTEQYSSLLVEEVQQMREQRQFTDFTIKTDEESFPCHRLMVAAHSPVIKATLTNDMAEAAQKSVSYDHINGKVMTVIMNYMYLGQIFFNVGLLMEMITACDYLQMHVLEQMCVDEVAAILKPTNVISWVKLATQLNLTALREKCTVLMVRSFTEISKLPDFLAMSYQEVLEYIKEVNKSDVERDEVLQAVMRWVDHAADDRLTHLETLLRQIKLERCTHPAILDVMKTYGASIVSCGAAVLDLMTDALQQLTIKATLQRTIVIIGGQVGEQVSCVCWKLNQAKQFVELCKIPYDNFTKRHSICQTPEGFAVTGGEQSDLCAMFVAKTKSWAKLPNMLTMRYRHGSICIKGVLYVLGGGVDGTGNKSVDSMVIKGSWQNEVDIPISVKLPRVAGLANIMYLLDQSTRQLHQLDVDTKQWSRLASCPVDVGSGTSMTTINDKLCVAGGSDRICSWYCPATDVWSVVQQPISCHYFGFLLHYDNSLLLLGGKDVRYNGSDEVEKLDIEDGSWSDSDIKMPASLFLHHALELEMLKED